jgi:hypothetical protein
VAHQCLLRLDMISSDEDSWLCALNVVGTMQARRAEEAESASLRDQMERALLHLSRAKESIAKATSLAINGVRLGLAASFMRSIVEHMQKVWTWPVTVLVRCVVRLPVRPVAKLLRN